MLVRQQLVAGSARLVSKGANARRSITIHETGNTAAGADATAHANLQARGNSRTASWHWTVDDAEAVQSYVHTDRCWHSGRTAGNDQSIAVEVCVNSDGNQMLAWRNAAELVRRIMAKEGLTVADVVQHNRWSGKNCPQRLRAGQDGLTWAGLLALLASPAATVVEPMPTPAPTPAAENQTTPPTTYAALLADGSWGALTTTALQVLLRAVGYYQGAIDGDRGPVTVRAIQSWLTELGYDTGSIDGYFGPITTKALQRFLAAKGLYAGRVDGDFGPLSVRALQGYLNGQRQYL